MVAKVSGSCLQGFPLRWGHLSQAEPLPGQAVPRLQSPAAEDIDRHHHDPVSFSKCSHRHDSHIGFTREVSKLQPLLLPPGSSGNYWGKEGVTFGVLTPAGGQEPIIANFNFPAFVPNQGRCVALGQARVGDK